MVDLNTHQPGLWVTHSPSSMELIKWGRQPQRDRSPETLIYFIVRKMGTKVERSLDRLDLVSFVTLLHRTKFSTVVECNKVNVTQVLHLSTNLRYLYCTFLTLFISFNSTLLHFRVWLVGLLYFLTFI